MRRRAGFVAAAVAAVAMGAVVSGCSAEPEAAASDQVTATPTPTAVDPFSVTFVTYASYSEAALQTGIRPDLVVREDGFVPGLESLCRSTPSDLAALVGTLRSAAALEDNPSYALLAMTDEVSLRLDLACPQRRGDWLDAGGGSAHPGMDEGFDTGTGSEPEETPSNFGPASLDGLTEAELNGTDTRTDEDAGFAHASEIDPAVSTTGTPAP